MSKPGAAHWTRRSLLTSAAALGAAPAARLLARGHPNGAAGVLIDGCGAPGDPAAEDGGELSPRTVADARASGITAINVTVGPVGPRPSLAAFEGIFRDIARWEEEIARHSETFLRVTAARDLEAARAARRVGLVYGL
jgi:membrane dipeptidase